MFKKLVIFALTALVSGLATASVRLHDAAPDSYTVKQGDTLWDIAGLYLDSPWQWPVLWQYNPAIAHPDRIYPGDVLRLQWLDGKPVLSYQAAGKRSDADPINSASSSLLRQFLTYDALISQHEYQLAPRVLGTQDGWQYISTRTPFFTDVPVDSDNWFVYRVVTPFERQKGDAVVSMMSLKKVGEATRGRTIDGMSEMKLIRQNQEIKPNDILLPALSAKTGTIFHPKPAPSAIAGNLVGHLYGSHYVGLRQIVVVDRGSQDGIDAGHVFSAIAPGAQMKGREGKMRYDSEVDNAADPVVRTLPDTSAGKLLVIRSYPFFSLAMVVEAQKPLKAGMPVVAEAGHGA